MKQDKKGHLEKTETLIKLGESVFNQVTPILNDDDDFDDRVYLKGSISEKIKNRRGRIGEIDRKKEELITKIIGQLHNGVLVTEKLSFRRGKCFEFRRQYPANIGTIKTIVMGNLHEVSEKLDKRKLDILEYVLGKFYVNKSNVYKNWVDENARQKIIRFPEIKIIEQSNNGIAEKGYHIFFLNGVVIADDGDVDFFFEYNDKDENDKLKSEFPSLSKKSFAGLYIKFEKEIEENAEIFVQELDTEIQNAEKEIAEITEKGQNQLALCELLQGDIKPYAH